MATFKLEIKEHSWTGGMQRPQYSCPYPREKQEARRPRTGIRLVRSLATGSACIVELNSNLLTAPQDRHASLFDQTKTMLSSFGCAFRYREGSVRPASFFDRILGKEDQQERCLYSLIPAGLLAKDEWALQLPQQGLRWFVLKGDQDPASVLEGIHSGHYTEKALLDACKAILFDSPDLFQLGIIAPGMTREDLAATLSLD